MTYWDGRDPSGKAVACSMLAVILVVGAPAFVLWADSNDGISSHTEIYDDYTEPGGFITFKIMQYWGTDRFINYPLTVYTPDVNDGSYLLQADDLPSNTEHRISVTNDIANADRIVLGFDIPAEIESMYISFNKTVDGQYTNIMNREFSESGGLWTLDLTPVESLLARESSSTLITFHTTELVALDEFEVEMHLYDETTVVPFDAVMTVAGILLIIGAVYATPYVGVGDLTRWGEKGARAAYRGGRKAYDGMKSRRKD